MDKVKLRNAGLGLLLGSALLAEVIGITIANKNSERVRKENSRLAAECMQVAAGEDNILDSKEAIDLAREFGYSGLILSNEKIILHGNTKTPDLLIGYNQEVETLFSPRSRDSMPVNSQQMRDYIKDHKK